MVGVNRRWQKIGKAFAAFSSAQLKIRNFQNEAQMKKYVDTYAYRIYAAQVCPFFVKGYAMC